METLKFTNKKNNITCQLGGKDINLSRNISYEKDSAEKKERIQDVVQEAFGWC